MAWPATAGPDGGLVSLTLDNGLRVTIHSDPSMSVVSTQVWYHVGSSNETPDTRGFAHLFEHLMFGRSQGYEKGAYAEHHHRHVGRANAYTTEDETVYVSEIVPEYHHEVLKMEADRMTRLILDGDSLETEKKIVTEELRLRTENDPQARAFVAALQAVLGDHPYSITPVGTKQDIASATLDHARDFYESFYGPGNAHLVVSGPVDLRRTLSEVMEEFGSLPARGSPPEEIPPLLDHELERYVELEEDLPPVETAVVAYLLPGPQSGDYEAVQVLAEILCRSAVDPFEDELVHRRRKGVFATSELLMQRRGGALLLAAAFLPYRSERSAFGLVDETIAELGRLEWLTEDALQSALRRVHRRIARRYYYPSASAHALGQSRWWFGDELRALDAVERAGRVSRADVERVWRTYVESRQPIRVYIRPQRVPLGVWLFGWLYPLVNR
jgi:zinc protease